MARYCKSCGSIILITFWKDQSFCIAQTYIINIIYTYRQTHPITLPRCEHVRRGVIMIIVVVIIMLAIRSKKW